VRTQDGALLFRPGGHGALLPNLQALEGDIVFVRNIDNIGPQHVDSNKPFYKKVLAGILLENRNRVFQYLRDLHERGLQSLPEEIDEFVMDRFRPTLPHDWSTFSSPDKADFYAAYLNRPMRVCGVVKNEGQPGGAPFWTMDSDHQVTPQIVESSQVDHNNPSQEAIFAASTHFNPVDLVCSIRDWHGKVFPLKTFRDPDTAFIAAKSDRGRPITVLEHPGLWNGGMAHWLTLFVDVPAETFSPVKTVFDLASLPHHTP